MLCPESLLAGPCGNLTADPLPTPLDPASLVLCHGLCELLNVSNRPGELLTRAQAIASLAAEHVLSPLLCL